MATLSNLLDKMIEATNENTVGVGQLSEEIDDLKDRVEAVENSGGGGTADSVEWDNVKNKPFGHSDEGVTILDNHTFTLTDGAYEGEGPILKVDALYKVIINGVVYDTVSKEIPFYGEKMITVIGDEGIMMGTPSGNYPFIMGYMAGMFVLILIDGSTECTVTLIERELVKISTKYYDAKKTFYRQAYNDDKYLYHDVGCTRKVTHEEFTEAYNKYPVHLEYNLLSGHPSAIRPVIYVSGGATETDPLTVYIHSATASSPSEYEFFYTAEYTAPTATEV